MNASDLYSHNFGSLQIAMASVLILAAIFISRFLKLSLEKDFALVSLRTVIQLIAVGFVLRWLFAGSSAFLNILVLLFMTLVASQAAVSRLKHKSYITFAIAFCALLGSAWPLGYMCLEVFFPVAAIKQSSFFIPFMGLVTGNALSAISLAMVNLERVRTESLLEIETFKSLGATPWESAHRIYRDLLRTSLTPTLNSMTIVGLVSLPGFMAGQIIGGVDPLSAARFQILVMFLLLLTSFVGTLIALYLAHNYLMPKWLTLPHTPWTFKIPIGNILVLNGKSGVGKTRLLKSMVGIDSVSVLESKKDVLNMQVLPSNEKAIYVNQRPHFIPGSVEENLKAPLQFKTHKNDVFDQKRVLKMLEDLELSTSILEKSATSLSGGEAQIINLIRALQFNPNYLILDEPTSAIDTHRTLLLEQFLKSWIIEDSRRIIMVTHNQNQSDRMSDQSVTIES